MAHKFLNTPHFNGNTAFQTHSAILDIAPYKPEVLIIGTYNDGLNANNLADFFYGRNYFWPIISNLSNNGNVLVQRRNHAGFLPNLNQILALCERLKLSFADIISDVVVQLPNHNDNHLNAALGHRNALSNDQAIIEFIHKTPSIKHVYATTKFNNQFHLNNVWMNIVNACPQASFGKILTPSGMGGIPNFRGLLRAATIARYWVWVNHLANPYGPFENQEGYTHFDHVWLTTKRIVPQNF